MDDIDACSQTSTSSTGSLPVSQSYLYDHLDKIRNTRRKQKLRSAMTAYCQTPVGEWQREKRNQTYRVRVNL